MCCGSTSSQAYMNNQRPSSPCVKRYWPYRVTHIHVLLHSLLLKLAYDHRHIPTHHKKEDITCQRIVVAYTNTDMWARVCPVWPCSPRHCFQTKVSLYYLA